MSKRMMLSRMLQNTGLLRALEMLPSRPGIIVVNHHRIGNVGCSRFDRGVFSETQDGLQEQVKAIRRRMPIISGEELTELVHGRHKLTRMHAAITFDDGYLDNYTKAFPVLQAEDCPATFFLVTQYVGTATIPWWDEIAYLVRNCQAPSITLDYPAAFTVALSDDRERTIHAVLAHYKRRDNLDPARFLATLRQEAACTVPPVGRRFLNWHEARQMLAAGMSIGSHTASHPVLSQLPLLEQQWELETSKAVLQSELGQSPDLLAYPVGSEGTFTAETERLAMAAGYSVALAFQGGISLLRTIEPTRLKRTSLPLGRLALRTDLALLSSTGRLPY